MDIHRLNDLAECKEILGKVRPKLHLLDLWRNQVTAERLEHLSCRVDRAAKYSDEPNPLDTVRQFATLVDEAIGPVALEEFSRQWHARVVQEVRQQIAHAQRR